MESENQDSAPPELPPRTSRKINLNEALAKTISSELTSRLSTIRTSGSVATPSRISGVQYDSSNAPPLPPKRGNVKLSDENLDDYDIPENNNVPPPIPPRGDYDISEDHAPPVLPPRGDNVPPPIPPRGADVRMSDENLDDFDIPEDDSPPTLPPRISEPDDEDDVPPPIPARNYHHVEEEEEDDDQEQIPAKNDNSVIKKLKSWKSKLKN
ncbi:hypothetical protein BCR36DRAFT_171548 [Piromyces finnis]|uniref:Uncharacterized protein n=1 Tax=Piromyces finnis TaxID=1754191 RepID=A0A1Y1UUW7_9FUNG|nr:hypothetical protein BCR36DRAFT_171548 [Piromyces finnis]|eukprot:ORX41814.1 hypothetical protein BCR36DRAFT_171548 [Piromyces finnis]